ncbi:hypothetical protein Pelo_14950 [Pelomyxa schiedti]|nr:hypothetical protein Pelo_14950 [Pelomyxa schiedti]
MAAVTPTAPRPQWKCSAGHLLQSRQLAQLAREEIAYRTGYRCDGCGTPSTVDPILHCSLCNYDMCPTCVTANMMCDNGHGLKETTLEKMAKVTVGYKRGFICNHCRSSFVDSSLPWGVKHKVWHCDVCQYDLDEGCAGGLKKWKTFPTLQCDNGHILFSRTHAQLKAETSDYTRGAICNRCRNDAVYPVLHCATCSYDLCSLCTSETLEQSQVPAKEVSPVITPEAALLAIKETPCPICEEPARIKIANCSHQFCLECSIQTLQMVMGNGQFPGRCPTCKVQAATATGAELLQQYIEPTLLLSLLNVSFFRDSTLWKGTTAAEYIRRFNAQQLQYIITTSETNNHLRAACPQCSTIVVGGNSLTEPCVRCFNPACAILFCRNCKIPWHRDLSCEQHTAQAARVEETEKLLKATSKPCPKCGSLISHYKSHGCHHIRPGTGCPSCHTHFCYLCLGPYPCRSGCSLFCTATCGCPPCPDCTKGHPCSNCTGCDVCRV